ncbi:MAG: type II toxin-antitoxin system VapC family toxin [Candidatus Brockarchaeota archaeon]|nr:type II toxin-antitoxin system VapC family toxin [Candidatus Brockarchaeota archaeon]
MFLIDTNIFLELFLNREKADECESFLEEVSSGDLEAVVTRFSIHAIEAILNNPKLILIFLRNIENSLGLTVYDTSMDEEMAVSMIMEEKKLDFDDALQYYVAKKLGVEAIVSFDKHFDKLDIPRREPKEVIRTLP